jgi:hypothetical protein
VATQCQGEGTCLRSDMNKLDRAENLALRALLKAR